MRVLGYPTATLREHGARKMSYGTPSVGIDIGGHRLRVNLEWRAWALPLFVAGFPPYLVVRVGPLCFSWRPL